MQSITEACKNGCGKKRRRRNKGVSPMEIKAYICPPRGVTSDHVYQNRYGDIIGVSGATVVEDAAVRLAWTELKKK